ncbi:MAG: hypothetical protein HQL51_16200 [Magnetococcales bacterium]|nr:hypothetical protein [Magnetococcales bacterium]
MNYRALFASLVLTAAAVPTAQAAAWYGGQFSAEITMSGTKDPANKAQGKLFIGADKARAEGNHNNETKVVIRDNAKQKFFTLLPGKKEYYEGLGDAPPPPMPEVDVLPADADSLCNTQKAHVACTKQGAETLDGVNVEKWLIQMTPPAQQGQPPQPPRLITMWVDPAKRAILKQETQGGPSMVRKFGGAGEMNGRQVEKWGVTQSFQNQSMSSTLWVDPKLKLTIKAVGGDYNMDVTNVQEGAQDPKLFEVPADFKQIQPPKPPQQPGSGPGGPPR